MRHPVDIAANEPTVARRARHVIINDMDHCSDDQRINVQTVAAWTGLKPGTINNRVRMGTFPSHIKKETPGPNFWIAGVIKEWVREQAA